MTHRPPGNAPTAGQCPRQTPPPTEPPHQILADQAPPGASVMEMCGRSVVGLIPNQAHLEYPFVR